MVLETTESCRGEIVVEGGLEINKQKNENRTKKRVSDQPGYEFSSAWNSNCSGFNDRKSLTQTSIAVKARKMTGIPGGLTHLLLV